MEVLERDVIRSISLLGFPFPKKGYKHCNVANHGWLYINGLGVKQFQCLCLREKNITHLFSIADRCVPLS